MRFWQQKQKLPQLFFSFLCILSFTQAASGLISAQTDSGLAGVLPASVSCVDQSIPTYSALFQASPDTYDVYVKLGKARQAASSSVYFQPFAGAKCTPIGTAQVGGDVWTKVGEWAASDQQSGTGTFVFASSAIQGLPDANRPTVLLVSKSKPICVPTVECSIRINGRTGDLRASGTLANEDSLRVISAHDPTADKLERVDYFVDNKPAYSSKQIEKFNLHYVGAGKHVLTTVATYASHQQVVLTDNVEQGVGYELNYLLYSFIFLHKAIAVILTVVLTTWLVSTIVIFILHTIYRRHMWKQRHFQAIRTQAQVKSSDVGPRHYHILEPERLPITYAKKAGKVVGILFGLTVVVALANSYAFGIFTVDGPSMQDTLHTGGKLFVNKLGKSWSHVSRQAYVPKREQVVVFAKQTSTLFGTSNSTKPTYVVKRVFGLPGERITVKGTEVRIYNQEHPNGFDPQKGQKWTSHAHLDNQTDIDITLGPDEVFVMGDNRPQSIDSRAYGAVKVDEIVGNVRL